MQKVRFFALIFLFLLIVGSAMAQTGAKYLVISHDNFVNAIKPLVDWKIKKGVPAVCVPLSVTGNTASQIKTYIQNAYNTWNPQPQYVLLVGSPDLLPSYYTSLGGYTDNYYADMTGNYEIELCIGRFLCSTVAQCSVMVAKTIGYEKSTTMHDSLWFSKGTTIVREDAPPDPYYQADTRYIRNLWLNAGYIQTDSFQNTRGNNQNDVVNAINNGRAFVVYRGQAVSMWWSPFTVLPNNTNNGYKLPMVVSGTCATLTLTPGENMLADSFLRVGTVLNPKGAVGFFGTTFIGSQISQPRGLVTKGFFQALYQDSIFTMGGAAKRGKFIMDSILANQTRYVEWNLLGDPELNIWTKQPQELTVTHDSIISLAPTNFQVVVMHASRPVRQALVCVMMDSTIYTYGYTNIAGRVTLSFTPQHIGTLQVTVTAHNYFPYEGTANVVQPDVGVSQIVRPSGMIDSTYQVIPQARVKNYGTTNGSFSVTFKIGTSYTQTCSKTLAAGNEDTVNFPAWFPIRGTFTTRCSTYLVGDVNPSNDTLSGSVTVGLRDVGVTQIIAPTGNITPGTIITQAARIANTSLYDQTFPVFFRIISVTDTSYYDDTTVTLEANRDSVIYFAIWNSIAGFYRTMVRTALAGDQNPGNDTASNNFSVISGSTSWQRMMDIPSAPSGKTPKNGCCVAPLAGQVYLLKANNSPDFYCFTPDASTGTWNTLTAIPLGDKATGDGKNPKKGAAIAAFGDKVYVLRGSNKPGFWHYTVTGGSWQKMKDIPTGASNPKDGSGMVYVNKDSNDCIFTMKGAKTSEFYLYFINGDNWQLVASPSVGTSGKAGYKNGSCLAYDGDSLVYVMKGNYGDFFKYNVLTNTWTELKRYDAKLFINRDGKKKKVKDGAGLAYLNSAVYLMKGGNTNEFWKYDIGANNWSQMNPATLWDIPGDIKVKSGGALCLLDYFFYAVKGNKTSEFYRHGPPTSVLTINPAPVKTEGTMSNKTEVDKLNLSIIPNPFNNLTTVKYNLPAAGPVSIKLYRINGELVKSFVSSNTGRNGLITIDTRALSCGVYLLRLDADKIKVTRKLILEK